MSTLWRQIFYGGREASTESRNITLIVATLIAAVTFQAGVNPPGGVWQDTKDGHTAGQAIYASKTKEFYVFLIFNTLALSSSVLKILMLTFGFPLYIEVFVATTSMVITYGSSVFAVTPKPVNYRFRYLLFTAASPLVLRLLIHGAHKFRRA